MVPEIVCDRMARADDDEIDGDPTVGAGGARDDDSGGCGFVRGGRAGERAGRRMRHSRSTGSDAPE